MININKKIVFGTGRFASLVLQNVNHGEIIAFLDNNQEKWGGLLNGIKIYSPQSIKEEVDLKDYPIYIASTYYEDISKQLSSMGLIAGKHYFDALTLLPVNQIRELLSKSPDIEDEFFELYVKVKNYTMTSFERLYALYQAVKYVIKSNILGDFVECGVWRGGSAMMIAETLQTLGIKDRKIYLYDTYQGMSEPSEVDIDYSGKKAETKWSESQADSINLWCCASIEDVKENLKRTGYPFDNLYFIKGKVEETIPESLPNNICLLRLDTDWYESTYHELEHLYPLLSLHGVLIIDDYGYWQGARKAVHDYFEKCNINILLNKIDFTGRLGVKVDE